MEYLFLLLCFPIVFANLPFNPNPKEGSLIRLDLDTQNGNYRIFVKEQEWFFSGPTALHTNNKWYLSSSQEQKLLEGSETLTFKGSSTVHGNDEVFGTYDKTTLHWVADDVVFETAFYVYHQNSIIVFEQSFPLGAEGTSLQNNMEVLSSFPSLKLAQPFYYTTFQGLWDQGTLGKANGTILDGYRGAFDGGVPLLIYPEDGSSTVVLSAFSNFPIGYQCQPLILNSIAFGLSGMIKSIPKGFKHSYILYADNKITETVYNWGSALLAKYQKKRSTDILIEYLGYWTDNGGYYYYNTDTGNYEDTVIAIAKYLLQENIPIKYFQFDSWFYFKGQGDGVKEWNSRPDIFPHGMKNVSDQIGLPVALHNRYWATDNIYQKNFPFIVESEEALPLDLQFWRYLMDQAASYNCLVYEQDWLIHQFQNMNATQTSVHTARDWLLQMGDAARQKGLTILYCLPLWNDFLQSVEIPAVTQIRVSDDYETGLNRGRKQWIIGKSSLVAWSLGLAPFKDVFWTTSQQPGNPYNGSEHNPQLQTLVSSLSTGPVGFGDKIGYVNRTLIMQTCDADGRLLKADKPATSIDRSFFPTGPEGEIWSTYSNISGFFWHYILGADLNKEFLLYPSDLYFSSNNSQVFNWNSPQLVNLFNNDNPIHFPVHNDVNWPFDYFVVVPTLPNKFVILGETNKFVTMSRQRFKSLELSQQMVKLSIQGSPTEVVTVSITYVGVNKIVSTPCTVGKDFVAILECTFVNVIQCHCS